MLPSVYIVSVGEECRAHKYIAVQIMSVDGSVDCQLSMWLSVLIMSGLVNAPPVSGVAACVDHSAFALGWKW